MLFFHLLFWYVLLLMFIVPSKNYVSKPRWLAQSKRTPPLAGKLQSPLCAGWQYVSFRILNYAGWLTSVVHDGWLGVLFPETLACWQWRAGNFFPGELNINEDWRRSTLLVVTTFYEQISQKWSLGTPEGVRRWKDLLKCHCVVGVLNFAEYKAPGW